MADVSSNLYSWSITAGSNGPAGTTTIGSGMDDNLREIQKVVRQNLAHYNSVAVASAATVDLGAQVGLFLDISGTTAITSFGTTGTAGIWKVLRFQDALTLTYNATSLILPGNADITTAADDVCIVYSLGTGNWMVASYLPGDNRQLASIVSVTGDVTLTLTATWKLHVVSDAAIVTLPAASTLRTGDIIKVKSTTEKSVTIVRAGSDTIDGLTSYRLPSYSTCEITKSAAGTYVLSDKPDENVGDWKWAGYGTANQGWVKAGQAVSRTTYGGLFAVYSTTFGIGDNATTFDLPNHLGRSPLGAGQGLTGEGDTTGTSRTLGQKGGYETHTLIEAEMPSHTHSGSISTQNINSGDSGGTSVQTPGAIGSTGGDDPHNNMAPFFVGELYIKT